MQIGVGLSDAAPGSVRATYWSSATSKPPDGNTWVLQEIGFDVSS